MKLELDLFRRGNLDELVATRGGLSQELSSKVPSPESITGDELLLRGLGALAFRVAGEMTNAVKIVGPFAKVSGGALAIDYEKTGVLGRRVGADKRKLSVRPVAFFLGQLAGLSYRYLQLSDVSRLAHRALEILASRGASDPPAVVAEDRLICRWEAQIWLYRGKRHEESSADEALAGLAAQYDEILLHHQKVHRDNSRSNAEKRRPTGWLDFFLAETLTVMASILWAKGATREASEHEELALSYLTSGSAAATLHHSYGLQLAARFRSESFPRPESASDAGSSLALSLAWKGEEIAQKALGICGLEAHGWQIRATLQRIRILIKAGKLQGVEQMLGSLNTAIETVCVSDPYEGERLQGEVALALVWLKEREALQQPFGSKEAEDMWRGAELQANRIGVGRVPPRLKLEQGFHRGRCRIAIPDMREGGLKDLERTLEDSRDLRRRKIEVACLLGLAEGHSHDEPAKALRAWRHARDALEELGLSSGFLVEWSRAIEPRVGGKGTIVLNLEDTRKAVVERVGLAHDLYHVTREGFPPSKAGMERLLRRTGYSRSTYGRAVERLRANKLLPEEEESEETSD